MELWTAFTIGLFGSFHCIGMCGPIAMALPGSNRALPTQLIQKSIYNTGRIVTYSLMGAVVGIAGYAISMAGLQRPLSILLGTLIIVFALFPLVLSTQIIRNLNPVRPFFDGIKETLGKQLKKSGGGTMLFIGMLNGLLPCGFVYVGLAGSLTRESILGSMSYMALFGLGTFPAMMLMAMAPSIFSLKMRKKISRLIPVLSILLGLYLIFRGIMMGATSHI